MRPSGEEIPFEIDAFRKHLLLNGLDDIGQTMQRAPAIDSYEANAANLAPRPSPPDVSSPSPVLNGRGPG